MKARRDAPALPIWRCARPFILRHPRWTHDHREPSVGTSAVTQAVVDTAHTRTGMAWFNRLTKAERAYWLDAAWRAASPVYVLDAMPSAADAWATFKAAQAARGAS
jgi:hypothetical protein